MNENIINESIKTPGFLKGFISGVVSTITIMLLILTPIMGFVLKDFSLKEIATYIYKAEKDKETVEKNKELFITLNNKIKNLEEINNSCKIDNDILKKESTNIQKINTLIDNYYKKYGDISYNDASIDYNKYKIAVYEFNAIQDQLRIYDLENHYMFFTKKFYNSMKAPENPIIIK